MALRLQNVSKIFLILPQNSQKKGVQMVSQAANKKVMPHSSHVVVDMALPINTPPRVAAAV